MLKWILLTMLLSMYMILTYLSFCTFLIDKPICIEDQTIYGVSEGETAHISCRVDSYPEADAFNWSFNTSSGGKKKILVKLQQTKAKLLLLKLIHLFARDVLLVKKLEIKETKTTLCSTFKTDKGWCDEFDSNVPKCDFFSILNFAYVFLVLCSRQVLVMFKGHRRK